jgi:hypothetical protein
MVGSRRKRTASMISLVTLAAGPAHDRDELLRIAAGQAGTACLCCAARGPRDTPASPLAIDADRPRP